MNKNLIAISIGDIDGIGIEILINLWKKNKINKFVLFTNKNIFENYLLINKIKLNINVVNEIYNKIENEFVRKYSKKFNLVIINE